MVVRCDCDLKCVSNIRFVCVCLVRFPVFGPICCISCCVDVLRSGRKYHYYGDVL